MIPLGSRNTIDDSSQLPNVSQAVAGFLRKTRVGLVQKQLFKGKTQEVPVWQDAMIFRQAIKEPIGITGEGNRSFKWHAIYTLPDLLLNNDDLICIGRKSYRIRNKEDWEEYGYLRYEAIEDYTEITL